MKKRQKGLAYYMPLAESIPYTFKKWAESLFDDIRYIFYKKVSEKKNSGYTGQCTLCNTEVFLEKAHSSYIVKCPHCGKKMILRNLKFSTHINSNSKVICYVQNLGNEEYMLRYFKGYFSVDYNDLTRKLVRHFSMCEHQRDIISGNNGAVIRKFHQTSNWIYDELTKKWKSNYHWINGFYPNMYGGDMSLWNVIYTYNINLLCLDKKLKYCPARDFFKENKYCNFSDFIKVYLESPIIVETLFKTKLITILNNYIYCKNRWSGWRDLTKIFDLNAKNVYQLLKVKNSKDFKFILKNNLSIKEVNALLHLREKNIKYTKELISFVKESELFSEKKVIALNYMNIQNLKKYANRQKYKDNYKDFINDYLDYINACVKLGYNTNDTMYYKPKKFKDMHDRTLTELEYLSNPLIYKKYSKIIKKYLKYGFKDNFYTLIVPQDGYEIKLEGKTQNHCVGSYLDRVVAEDSLILLLRKNTELEKSFYTMEINLKTNTINQCRGYKNANPTSSVKLFMKKYESQILNVFIKEKETATIKAAV